MSVDPLESGVRGTLNPSRDSILYREVCLSAAKIALYRPFDQTKSDAEQPIRVVVTPAGERIIMQGNHRVYGAQVDGLTSIGAIVYTPEQWEAFTGLPFRPGGLDSPVIG